MGVGACSKFLRFKVFHPKKLLSYVAIRCPTVEDDIGLLFRDLLTEKNALASINLLWLLCLPQAMQVTILTGGNLLGIYIKCGFRYISRL